MENKMIVFWIFDKVMIFDLKPDMHTIKYNVAVMRLSGESQQRIV